MKAQTIKYSLLILLLLTCRIPGFAQQNNLQEEIAKITSKKNAEIGVAVYDLETGTTIALLNGNKHFVMQSVFKFHIALAVLAKVDSGFLSLTQQILVKPTDLLLDTWSPLRDKYPDGNVALTLDEIIRYTVSQSDNNGCDILLRLIGGPRIVANYLHDIGIKDVDIRVNEEEMHRLWNAQFSNWTTPVAAVELLAAFYNQKILSTASFIYLWNVMVETTTGKNRIKGKLPAGTEVAHKTGTSSTNSQGITAAVNDIGIVVLPDGCKFAIAMFVNNSKENEETNEKIIADIAKLVWDYYVKK